MTRRAAALVGLSLAACQPASTEPAPPRTVTAVAAEPPEPPAAPPAPDAGAAEPAEQMMSVEYVADGTLIIAGTRTLVARAPNGAIKRMELEPNATIGASIEFPGVVIQLPDGNTRLLETPSLTQLYAGKGEPLLLARNVVRHERSVHFQRAGKLRSVPLPSTAPPEAEIEDLVAVGTERLNLTYHDASYLKFGVLYDANTTAVVGEGVPLDSIPAQAPRGAITGNIGFRIDGNRVLRIDLKSGLVERQATYRCKPDQQLGNPTPSPSGDLLLVTCDNDGVVLDGKKLTRKRQIARILPGCDNGPILGGTVLRDGHTLLLEGCGGEARIDLGTGKYECGDSPGVMGAPYEPFPGSPGMPAGRGKTPACNNGEFSQSKLGRSKRIARLFDPPMLVVDGTKIALEADSGFQGSLAPDESAFAYPHGDRVTIRSLPDGKVKAELRLAGTP